MHIRKKRLTFARYCAFLRAIAKSKLYELKRTHLLLLLCCMALPLQAQTDERIYHLEVGVDGGCGYYVGDAGRRIFQNVREAYGVGFRYMFDRRWSIRAKGMTQRIAGYLPDGTGFANKSMGMWQNRLVNIDAVAEFNFLPFGKMRYDSRIKPITPYLALGIGISMHSNWKKISGYAPFIIGMKWRCAQHVTIHLAWEHDVYFGDNLENISEYANTYNLNGKNIMNVDVTGQLVAGIAFCFLQDKKVCRTCN